MNRSDWRRRPGRSSSWLRRSTRFAVYARDGFNCVYCRKFKVPVYDGKGLTVEHIVPRKLGGTHAAENLATACFSCNSARQDKKLPRRMERRLLRLASRPLNRQLGRVLAAIYLVQRQNTQLNSILSTCGSHFSSGVSRSTQSTAM